MGDSLIPRLGTRLMGGQYPLKWLMGGQPHKAPGYEADGGTLSTEMADGGTVSSVTVSSVTAV